jgi:predicted dehydrogenase
VIRLGIIGCGWVTEMVHLPVLQRLRGITVTAACDTRAERLQHLHSFGIARSYQNWQELVADPEVDAILVATPGDYHARIAHGVLAAQKHVLVEKPLSLTIAESQDLCREARSADVVAMVGLNYRFHPLVQKLRKAIQDGDIGRPVSMLVTLMSMLGQRTSITGYETQPHMGGGVFYDKVVHALDVIRFLFDCEVATGQAMSQSETHAHDFATVSITLENGVSVSGVFSDRVLPDFTCLVFGDEGKAMINLTRPTGVLLYRKRYVQSRIAKWSGYAQQLMNIASNLMYFSTSQGQLCSYYKQWQQFIHGVETHSAPRPNFDDGLAITYTLQQLLTSLPVHPENS